METRELVKTGKFVLSSQKDHLESIVLAMPDLADKIHISSSGGGVTPYFIDLHPNRFCPDLEKHLNEM